MRIRSLAAATTLALVTAGCGVPDYSGEGSNFTVEGKMVSVDQGEHAVWIDIRKANAEGKAANSIFEGGVTEFYDRYKNVSCDVKKVGREVDVHGEKEKLSDLNAGDVVRAEGRIRASKNVCGPYPTYTDRPVFEYVRELK